MRAPVPRRTRGQQFSSPLLATLRAAAFACVVAWAATETFALVPVQTDSCATAILAPRLATVDVQSAVGSDLLIHPANGNSDQILLHDEGIDVSSLTPGGTWAADTVLELQIFSEQTALFVKSVALLDSNGDAVATAEINPDTQPQSADNGLTSKVVVAISGDATPGDPTAVQALRLQTNANAASSGIEFTVRGVYLRSGCKDCGTPGFGFVREDASFPMHAVPHAEEIAGGSPYFPADRAFDASPILDPACGCLSSGTLVFDVVGRSLGNVPQTYAIQDDAGNVLLSGELGITQMEVDNAWDGTQSVVRRTIQLTAANVEERVFTQRPWSQVWLTVGFPLPCCGYSPIDPSTYADVAPIILATFSPSAAPLVHYLAATGQEYAVAGALESSIMLGSGGSSVVADAGLQDWSLLQDACGGAGSFPCADLVLEMDVNVAGTLELQALVITDTQGRTAEWTLPTAAEHEEWVRVTALGTALAGTIGWDEVASLGFRRTGGDFHFGGPALTANVRNVRVVVDHDALDCPEGSRPTSDHTYVDTLVRNAHCSACCCEFDTPDGDLFCYDHGDVVGVVTPSEDRDPNEMCQVCNALESTSVATSAALLQEGYPCDDGDLCTYNDQCTTEGLCVATPYPAQTCMIGSEWGDDPSLDCEECDGTGPDSPTHGCRPRDGHYVWGDGANPGDDRKCGCLFNDEVVGHEQLSLQSQCKRCDVAQSNEALVDEEEDSVCDPTLESIWRGTKDEFCQHSHVCKSGVCTGVPYSCPAIGECAAGSDDFPFSCDMSGASGCVVETRPEGALCRRGGNGCELPARCNGVTHTCPIADILPGIIGTDDDKELRVLRGDNEYAYAPAPAISSTDQASAAFYNYHVQCDNDFIKLAVIPEGACTATRVTEELSSMWGKDFAPIPFGSAAISTTGTFEFKFKDTPELGRLDYGGDSADDLNVAIPDLSSFATPSCECVVNGYIDAEVYLTSADLGIGFIGLVDEDDVEVTANITEGQVIGAETWSRVSFVLPGVQGKLQWGSVKSWFVVHDDYGERVAGDSDPSVQLKVRNVALRVQYDTPCADAVVNSAAKAFTMSSGTTEQLELTFTPTASALSSLMDRNANNRLVANTFITADVYVAQSNVAPLTLRLVDEDGEGLELTLGAYSQVGVAKGWRRYTVAITESSYATANGSPDWWGIKQALLKVPAGLVDSAGASDFQLGLVYAVANDGECHPLIGESLGRRGPVYQALSAGDAVEVALSSGGATINSGADIDLGSNHGLQRFYSIDCSCLFETYLRLELALDSAASLPATVSLLDGSGAGVVAPLNALDIDGFKLGLDTPVVFRTPLGEAEIVGSVADWDAVTRLSFQRADGASTDGTMKVLSLEVRRLRLVDDGDGCRSYNVTGGESLLLLDDEIVPLAADSQLPPTSAILPAARLAGLSPSFLASLLHTPGFAWSSIGAADSPLAAAGGTVTQDGAVLGPVTLATDTGAGVVATLHDGELRVGHVFTFRTTTIRGDGATVVSVDPMADGASMVAAVTVDTGTSGDDVHVFANANPTAVASVTGTFGSTDGVVVAVGGMDGEVSWATVFGSDAEDALLTTAVTPTRVVCGGWMSGTVDDTVFATETQRTAMNAALQAGFLVSLDAATGAIVAAAAVPQTAGSGDVSAITHVAASMDGAHVYVAGCVTAADDATINSATLSGGATHHFVARLDAKTLEETAWVVTTAQPVSALQVVDKNVIVTLPVAADGVVSIATSDGEYTFEASADEYASGAAVLTIQAFNGNLVHGIVLSSSSGSPVNATAVARVGSDLFVSLAAVPGAEVQFHEVNVTGVDAADHSSTEWLSGSQFELASGGTYALLRMALSADNEVASVVATLETVGSTTAPSAVAVTSDLRLLWIGVGAGGVRAGASLVSGGDLEGGVVGVWSPLRDEIKARRTHVAGFLRTRGNSTDHLVDAASNGASVVAVGVNVAGDDSDSAVGRTRGVMVVTDGRTGASTHHIVDVGDAAEALTANATALTAVTAAASGTANLFVAAGSYVASGRGHVSVLGQPFAVAASISAAAGNRVPLLFATSFGASGDTNVSWVANLACHGSTYVADVDTSGNGSGVWVVWGGTGDASDGATTLFENQAGVTVGLLTLVSVSSGTSERTAVFGGDSESHVTLSAVSALPGSPSVAVAGHISGTNDALMPGAEILVARGDDTETGFVAVINGVTMATVWAKAVTGGSSSFVDVSGVALTAGAVVFCGQVESSDQATVELNSDTTAMGEGSPLAFYGGVDAVTGSALYLTGLGEGQCGGVSATGAVAIASMTELPGDGALSITAPQPTAHTVLHVVATNTGEAIETVPSHITLYATVDGRPVEEASSTLDGGAGGGAGGDGGCMMPPCRRLSTDGAWVASMEAVAHATGVSYSVDANAFLVPVQVQGSTLHAAEELCDPDSFCDSVAVWHVGAQRSSHPDATVVLAIDANFTGLATETIGQFGTTADEWGTAYGFGVSVGTHSIVSAGFFVGKVALGGGVVLTGDGDMDTELYDGFVAISDKTGGGQAGLRVHVDATDGLMSGVASDDYMYGCAALPDGSRHFCVGYLTGVKDAPFKVGTVEYTMPDDSAAVIVAVNDDTRDVAWSHMWSTVGGTDKLYAAAAAEGLALAAGKTSGRPLVAGAYAYPADMGTRELGLVIGLDTSGSEVFGIAFGTSNGDGRAAVSALAVNSRSSLLCVAGYFMGDALDIGTASLSGETSVDATFAFVAMYALDGTSEPMFMWAQTNTQTPVTDADNAIRGAAFLASSSAVVVGGDFSGPAITFSSTVSADLPASAPTFAGFVAAFAATDGTPMWATVTDSSGPSSVTGVSTIGDTVYAIGFASGRLAVGDIVGVDLVATTSNRGFIAALASDTGKASHMELLGGIGTPDNIPYSIDSDGTRNLVASGFRTGTVEFNLPGETLGTWTEDNYPDNSVWPDNMPMLIGFDAGKVASKFRLHGVDNVAYTATGGSSATVLTSVLATGIQTTVSAITFMDGDMAIPGFPGSVSAGANTQSILVSRRTESGATVRYHPIAIDGNDVHVTGMTSAANGQLLCFVGTVAGSGSVELLGSSHSLAGGFDIVVGCISDETGDVVWTKTFGSAEDDIGSSIDSRGSVLVLGATTSGTVSVDSATIANSPGSGSAQCLLVALQVSDGSFLWGRVFGSEDASAYCEVNGVALDTDASGVYAAGGFASATFDLSEANKPASPNSAKLQPFVVHVQASDQSADFKSVPTSSGATDTATAGTATGVAVAHGDGTVFVSFQMDAAALEWTAVDASTVTATKAGTAPRACVMAAMDVDGSRAPAWVHVLSASMSAGSACPGVAASQTSGIFTVNVESAIDLDGEAVAWWPTVWSFDSPAAVLVRWSGLGGFESRSYMGTGSSAGVGTSVHSVKVDARGMVFAAGVYHGDAMSIDGAVWGGSLSTVAPLAASSPRAATVFTAAYLPVELVVSDDMPVTSHDFSSFVDEKSGCITDASLIVEAYMQPGASLHAATLKSPTTGAGFQVEFTEVPSSSDAWITFAADVTAASNFLVGLPAASYSDLRLSLTRASELDAAPLALRNVHMARTPQQCFECGNITLVDNIPADVRPLVDPHCNCLRGAEVVITLHNDDPLVVATDTPPRRIVITSTHAGGGRVEWKCGDSPVYKIVGEDGWTWLIVQLGASTHVNAGDMDFSSVEAEFEWGCTTEDWDSQFGDTTDTSDAEGEEDDGGAGGAGSGGSGGYGDIVDPVLPVSDGPVDAPAHIVKMELRRQCPDSDSILHPNPQTTDFEFVALRRDLNLNHGEYYHFISVEQNIWGDELTTCSERFIVDTTPPDVSAMEAFDMIPKLGQTREDVDLHGEPKFRVAWTGAATDPEVTDGIFEFRISDVKQGCSSCPTMEGFKPSAEWTIGGAASLLEIDSDEFTIADGNTFYVELAVRNHAGLEATVITDGVTVDASAPQPQSAILDTAALPTSGSGNEDIDYQSDNTKVYGFMPVFDEPHSDIDKFQIGLGTSTDGPNTVTWADLTVSDDTVFQALTIEHSLQDGSVYYMFVRAWNTAGASEDFHSDGVLVDTSAPVLTYVVGVFPFTVGDDDAGWTDNDANNGVSFHDGVSVVRAKWRCDDLDSIQYDVDKGHGIVGNATYRWRVCTSNDCSSGTTLTDWMDADEQQYGETSEGLGGLDGGTSVYVQVECKNPAGLTSTGVSDAMVVDKTPPDATNAVIDDLLPGGASNEEVDLHGKNQLKAVWSGFTTDVNKPALKGYSVAVGTTYNGSDVKDFENVGLTTSWESAEGDLNLVSGTTYHVTIMASTTAGAFVARATDGVLVDLDDPVVDDAQVFDAPTTADGVDLCPNLDCVAITDRDISAQAATSFVSVNFTGFVDEASGIVEYLWGVSLCDNVTTYGVLALTPTDSADFSFSQSLATPLQHGVEYCSVIIAKDAVGRESATVVSDGFVCDLTPPRITYVHDGADAGRDQRSTAFRGSYNVSYGCEDPESGVHHYLVRLSSRAATDGAVTHLTGFEVVDGGPAALYAHFRNGGLGGEFVLTHGDTAFATVRCVNNAGVYAEAQSNGAVIDLTPPALDDVNIYHDLSSIVVDATTSRTIRASWSGFFDAESHIQRFEWAVGSQPMQDDVVARASVGGATVAVAEDVAALQEGSTYFVTVWAITEATHVASASSAGFLFDSSAPTGGDVTVTPSEGADAGYISSVFKLDVEFEGFEDPHDANITYKWAIGTSEFGEQTMPYTLLPWNSTRAVAEDLGLHAGSQYFVTVAAVNDAGLARVVSSSAVVPDPYPPLAGRVVDGSSASHDSAFTLDSETSLSCAWTPFVDSISGIKALTVALGSSPGANDVVDFEAASSVTATSHTFSSLTLAHGTTYHCTVHALDRAGNAVTASSDGVIADGTAPVEGEVLDGDYFGQDLDWTSKQGALSVQFVGWSDPESSLAALEWSVGSADDATLYAPWMIVPTYATHASRVVEGGLQAGVEYVSHIRATNAVGATTLGVSDGIQLINSTTTAAISDRLDVSATIKVLQALPQPDGLTCTCADENAWFDAATSTCLCKPDFYLNSDGTCVTCPASTCKPSMGNALAACVAEPCGASDSMPQPAAATACGDQGDQALTGGGACECAPGTYLDQGVCTACADSTFKDVAGNGESLCHPCWKPREEGAAAAGLLAVRWDASEVATHQPDAHVRISVGYARGAAVWAVDLDPTDTSSWVQLGPEQMPGNAMAQGTVLYATVSLISVDTGLEVTSSTVRVGPVDWSPPVAGIVSDGSLLRDAATVTTADVLNATWGEFIDPESAVTYQLGFGSQPGDTDLSGGFVAVPQSLAALQGGVLAGGAATTSTLSNGDQTYATVVATNAAGLSTVAWSNGAKFSATAAPSVVVKVVAAADAVAAAADPAAAVHITGQATGSAVHVVWSSPYTAADGVSFRWALVEATDGGGNGTLITGWHDAGVGLQTAASLTTGLSIAAGTTFVARLRVVDGGAVHEYESRNTTVDTTAPDVTHIAVAGMALEPSLLLATDAGVGPTTSTRVYTATTDTVEAQWRGDDSDSGVASYTVAIGSVSSGVQGMEVTAVDTTSATFTGLDLQHGHCHRVSVSAINGAGIASPVASSRSMVCVDTTAPLVTVRPQPVRGMAAAGGPEGAAVEALADAAPDDALRIVVQATDSEAPITAVKYAVLSDAAESAWSAAAASALELDLAGASQIAAGSEIAINVTLGSLTEDVPLFVHIEAANAAGLTTHAVSPEFVMTSAVPELGDGSAASWQASQDTVRMAWAWQPAVVVVAVERWAVARTAGVGAASETLAEGVVTQGAGVATATGLALQPHSETGPQYEVVITGCNAAGLCATYRSDLRVDVSAPTTGSVHLERGGSPYTGQPVSADQLLESVVVWQGFFDDEVAAANGTLTYIVSAGTAAGNTQLAMEVVPGTIPGGSDVLSLALSQLLDGVNVDVQVPQALHVTVAAKNGAGAFTVVAAAPLVLDGRLPSVGTVEIVSGATVAASEPVLALDGASMIAPTSRVVQTSASNVAVAWSAFSDGRGTLVDCELSLVDLASGTPVANGVAKVNCSTDGRAELGGLDLATGLPGFVAIITATDAAGLAASMDSAGVPLVVDATPPVVKGVRDGLVAGFSADVNCGPRFGSTLGSVTRVDAVAVVADTVTDGGGDASALPLTAYTQLGAQWSAVIDDESGVAAVQVAVATSPGSDGDVMAWQDVPASASAAALRIAPQPVGRHLFVGVRARNGAGQWSEGAWSDGVMMVCGEGDEAVECSFGGAFVCS